MERLFDDRIDESAYVTSPNVISISRTLARSLSRDLFVAPGLSISNSNSNSKISQSIGSNSSCSKLWTILGQNGKDESPDTDRSSLDDDGRARCAAYRGRTNHGSYGTSARFRLRSPGGIIDAMEVAYPPSAKMSAVRKKVEIKAKESEDFDIDGALDRGINAAEENPAGPYGDMEPTLSQGETIVEATQVECPPPATTAAPAREPTDYGAREKTSTGRGEHRWPPDLRVSPVHSSLAAAGESAEFDTAFDEETVGFMDSPPSERRGIDLSDEPGNGKADSGQGVKLPRHRRDASVAQAAKPRCDESRKRNRAAKRDHSLECAEPRGIRGGENSLSDLSLEKETRANTHKAGGETMGESSNHTRGSSGASDTACSGHIEEDRASRVELSLRASREFDEDAKLVLTSVDIRHCIEATEVAKSIIDADRSQDPIDSIDIEQWQSIFEDFEKYIDSLGSPSSSEAKELELVAGHDRVFAIFDRGMDVNHCNALFMHDMIRTMSGGIRAQIESGSRLNRGRHSQRETHRGYEKLDLLAACLDTVFGVSEGSSPTSTAWSVTISKVDSDSATVLKFYESSASIQGVAIPSSTIEQPPPSTLPPPLQAMSEIFARFAAESAQPLIAHADSTQKTLTVTREGAMDLQRKALDLEERVQKLKTYAKEANAKRERTEAEMGRQKCEFERTEKSFERMKEHYKAEIDRMALELMDVKDRYERELKEARADIARVELEYAEQRDTKQTVIDQRKRKESDSRRGEHQIKHHRNKHPGRPGERHPDHNTNLRAEADGDGRISLSIARNIRFDRDVEGSTKGSEVPDRRSRHSTGTMGRPAPYELRPPLRPRASSEQRARVANKKMDRHSTTRRNVEQKGEFEGHFGEQIGKQLNPSNSVTGNSFGYGANFPQKEGPRNSRDRSTRRGLRPREENIELEEN